MYCSLHLKNDLKTTKNALVRETSASLTSALWLSLKASYDGMKGVSEPVLMAWKGYDEGPITWGDST